MTQVKDAENGGQPIYARYTVKKVTDFPVPSRDATYQTLPGGE